MNISHLKSKKAMTTIQINVSNNTIDAFIPAVIFDDNNANFTNESSIISLFSTSSQNHAFAWNFNWNIIILSALALVFLIVLVGTGIWFWCNRVHHVHRRHSLPMTVDNFIEPRKIQENQFSSSPILHVPNKPPPIPPRPVSYTTILGRVEYRSNL
ncbi:hypothetical protein I4U23_020543 [Adineta vaga]|nr:hypothetical protein I4U23_020543 [Adineta vaga]